MLISLLGTALSFLARLLSDWLTKLRRDQDLEELGARQQTARQTAIAAQAAADARTIEREGAEAPIDPAIFRKDS